MVTRQPGSAPAGGIRIEGGEDRYGLVQGSLSGPLGGNLSAGIAGRVSTIDGFVPNAAPGGGRKVG